MGTKGKSEGFDSDFENFFDTVLDLFSDIEGDFSNINIKPKPKKTKTEKDFFEVKDSCVCKYCLEYFSSKGAKDYHIKRFHEKMQIFSCKNCDLSFRTQNGLNSHTKAKHGITNVHICETCGQVYQNMSSLLRHCKQTTHNFPLDKEAKSLPKGFSRCNLCLKLVSNLLHHRNTYHSRKEKRLRSMNVTNVILVQTEMIRF